MKGGCMPVASLELTGSEVVLPGEQIDLFVESLVAAPLRNDRATMEFPFFALQKRPLMTPITYQDGNVSIRVSPGERGIASIWDKDVLIYLSSLINAKIERGEEVSRTVRIAAYDMLRVTRRHTGKNGYQEIYDALFRLRRRGQGVPGERYRVRADPRAVRQADRILPGAQACRGGNRLGTRTGALTAMVRGVRTRRGTEKCLARGRDGEGPSLRNI